MGVKTSTLVAAIVISVAAATVTILRGLNRRPAAAPATITAKTTDVI